MKPTVFFAVPCGEFYTHQHEIICRVAKSLGFKEVILEDHRGTKDLWKTITDKIDDADFFVADISSKSFNVALELGYAMRSKPHRKIGVFIAKSQPIPADLQGFVCQTYSSFREFEINLREWATKTLGIESRKQKSKTRRDGSVLFREDFADHDLFWRRWTTPPGSSFLLTHEGLRFSSSTLPILTSTLGLLADCEIEFMARIEQDKLGWVVKGTRDRNHHIPAFCVLLQIDAKGNLRPHIWTKKKLDKRQGYQAFNHTAVDLRFSKTGWFNLKTQIKGSRISVSQGSRILFDADFESEQPYAAFYNTITPKEGQIGFRCYGDEEAVIRSVEVREI